MTIAVGDKILCEPHPVPCTVFRIVPGTNSHIPNIYIEYYFGNDKIFDWIFESEILKKI
jgi:hypothetical protein